MDGIDDFIQGAVSKLRDAMPNDIWQEIEQNTGQDLRPPPPPSSFLRDVLNNPDNQAAMGMAYWKRPTPLLPKLQTKALPVTDEEAELLGLLNNRVGNSERLKHGPRAETQARTDAIRDLLALGEHPRDIAQTINKPEYYVRDRAGTLRLKRSPLEQSPLEDVLPEPTISDWEVGPNGVMVRRSGN